MNIRYKMLPRSNPKDDYYTERNEIIDSNNRIIGSIQNKDGSFSIDIWESDELIERTRHRFMFFECNEREYLTGCRIVMSSFFVRQLQEKPFLFSLVWHEVGHFHTLPYVLDDTIDIPTQRMASIENGTVMVDEQIADMFAMFAGGKDNLVQALRWAREGRKQGIGLHPGLIVEEHNILMGSREYNNRIRLIKETNEDTAYEFFLELFEKNRLR